MLTLLATIGLQCDLLKATVLTVGITDRSIPRLRADEKRDLAAALIINPLDAPNSGVMPILEYLCGLRHTALRCEAQNGDDIKSVKANTRKRNDFAHWRYPRLPRPQIRVRPPPPTRRWAERTPAAP
jgi:hypothetical protein